MALEQQRGHSNFRAKALAAALRCCWSKRAKEDTLDVNLWGNLVGMPLEIVLAQLPLPSLIRCRSVCKSWNALLSSQDFLDKIDHTHRTGNAQHESWLMSDTVTKNQTAFYVPSLREWRITTLPLDMHYHDGVLLKPGMGGLVCLTKSSRVGRSCITDVFVWNPLTNDCRQLPRDSRYFVWGGIRTAGMYVNYTTKEYKVIIVEDFRREPWFGTLNTNAAVVTYVYDSSTNAWKLCDSRFPHETGSTYDENIDICCDLSMYSITTKLSLQTGVQLHYIVAFEMKTEVWREIKVQPMEYVETPSFVELDNKVYMVGGLLRDDSICMWRLVEHADGRGEWMEADRLPQELVELIMGKTDVYENVANDRNLLWSPGWNTSRKHWRCIGSGDSLFFRILETPVGFLYSISRRSWSSVPACDENRRSNSRYHGFASTPGWILP